MSKFKGLGSYVTAGLLATTVTVPAFAAAAPPPGTVVNPGFESGDFSGWTTEGGLWTDGSWPVNETLYKGKPATLASIMTAGALDPITGVPAVFAGNFSARLNDSAPDYDITALRQSITGYNANKLYYAWNAVLEPSHGETDSPSFLIKVTDKTTNTVVTNIGYSAYSAQNSPIFRKAGNFVTTDWKVEDVDTITGHDYEMLFVAVDCAHGGHAGYVYVDAFGNVVPTPNAGVTFNAASDVVRGATFLLPIGGIGEILNFHTLTALQGGQVIPTFRGGTFQIDQVTGPVTVAFSVSDLGGILDTNGNDVEFTGGFAGTGIITKSGLGTWLLSGINTINGGVVVNQGGLNVNGLLSSLVINVNAGTRLLGRGQIVAAVNVRRGGVIAPGNSPGTLTVVGSPVIMDAGSTYEADIDGRVYNIAGGAGTYDRIALTSGATFTAGGTLSPILRGITGAASNTFTPVLGDRFTIVDGGVVSGAFATVNQPASGLAANTRFDVAYNPTSVQLVVTPGSFGVLGGTAGWRTNAIAVGQALDAVRRAAGSRTGSLQSLFDSVYGADAAGYGAMFEQLSGEIHAEAMTVTANAAHGTSKLALNAAAVTLGSEDCVEGAQVAGKCLEPTGRPALWTQLYYQKSRFGSDVRSARFSSKQRGFAVGAHLVNLPDARLGVGARYSDNEIANGIGGTADANGFTLFGYASHDFGPLTVSSTIGWGTTDVHSTRAQSLLTGNSVSTARYEAHTLNAALEARYTLPVGANAVLRPVAGVTYDQLTVKAAQELNPGAPVALSLPHTTRHVTRTKLGAEAAVGLGPVSLVANGTWSRVVDGNPTMVRRVTLGPAQWNVSSVGMKRDSFEFGAGVQASLGHGTTLRLEYAGVRDSGRYKSDQGFVRLSHAF